MATKIVKCLKCKCEFESEVDKQGIPYNRLCEQHRKMSIKESQAELIRNVYNDINKVRKRRSKIDKSTFYSPLEDIWIGYSISPFTFKKREVCRHKNEQECINMRKLILAIDKRTCDGE